MAGVVVTSSRLDVECLDAESSAVRQDRGGRLTRPWEGGVVEATSPWASATPKSDLYAKDMFAEDLSAMVGAPLQGGTGLGLRRCELRFSQGSVRHEGKGESRAASSASSGSATPSPPRAWRKTCTPVICFAMNLFTVALFVAICASRTCASRLELHDLFIKGCVVGEGRPRLGRDTQEDDGLV